MKLFILRMIFLTLSTGLTACSTPLKEAQEQLAQGNLEAAEEKFDEAWRENPTDEDAQTGRTTARKKILEKQLASAQGLDALLSAHRKAQTWKIPLEADKSSAWSQFESKIEQDLKLGFPLRAKSHFDLYLPIFGDKMENQEVQLAKTIGEAGQKQCRQWLAAGVLDFPSFATLVSEFCETFQLPQPALADLVGKQRARFYRAIQCDVNVSELPHDQVLSLGEKLQKRLAETPYYDRFGQGVLSMTATGTALTEQSKEPVALKHTYSSDKTQEVYEHSGWKHSQNLSVDLMLRLSLWNSPVNLKLKESSRTTGIEHFDDIPKIGLHAQSAKIPDAGIWWNQSINSLVESFYTHALGEWRIKNCKTPPAKASAGRLADSATQCAHHLMTGHPEFVLSWYKKNFGMSPVEVETALGSKL